MCVCMCAHTCVHVHSLREKTNTLRDLGDVGQESFRRNE